MYDYTKVVRNEKGGYKAFHIKDERGYYCLECGKDLNHWKRKQWNCGKHKDSAWSREHFNGLRPEVLKRDNNKCVECGRGDITLNVHHKNHNHKDNRMENLETLCVNCHTKKRIFTCVDCHKKSRANGSNQVRCVKCGVKHEKNMSYIRLARYWKKRNEANYQWYFKRIDPAYKLTAIKL